MRRPQNETPKKLHFLVNVICVYNIFGGFHNVNEFIDNGFPFHSIPSVMNALEAIMAIWGNLWIISGKIIGTIVLGITLVVGLIFNLLFCDIKSDWHPTFILTVQTLAPLLLLFCEKNDISGWEILKKINQSHIEQNFNDSAP